MATRKSPTSAEKKPTTRKAQTRKAAAASAGDPPAGPVVVRHVPTYEEISRLAEQFWVERGRPFGSPEVDWLRAEATLHAA